MIDKKAPSKGLFYSAIIIPFTVDPSCPLKDVPSKKAHTIIRGGCIPPVGMSGSCIVIFELVSVTSLPQYLSVVLNFQEHRHAPFNLYTLSVGVNKSIA